MPLDNHVMVLNILLVISKTELAQMNLPSIAVEAVLKHYYNVLAVLISCFPVSSYGHHVLSSHHVLGVRFAL